jgi:hypothetical protein
MSEPRKRKEKNVNVKKENNMGHGIGPQNLGAAGMSTKSKPCGTPLDFNDNLRAALPEIRKNSPGFAKAIEADSNSPATFQDDITKIQDAASTLEAHNIGGAGEVQGAAAMAQENAASQMGQSRAGFANENVRGAFMSLLGRRNRLRREM